jgi:UDP-3-O-[3-hydroxymyristoyl] glucosamine N-acyltransferase
MRAADLAAAIGARLDGDPDLEIRGAAPIDEATTGELTFVANPRYRSLMATTRASAIVVASDAGASGRTLLRTDDPALAFAKALALLDVRPLASPGVHPTAVVASSARIGEGAYVGPFAVIGDDVLIGRNARIHAHVVIYPQARIGDRFTAHAGAVIRECVSIGDDVVLQPGAVIGGDGFGYLPRPGRRPEPVRQIGSVVVGDAVEVGSNATVDRAAVGATHLGDGVKLDNLVMVAHGCRVGAGSLLAAQTGLAGSTVLGRDVMTGGQVGFAGHGVIGDAVRVAAQSGVPGDVAAGRTIAGSPAMDIAAWRRAAAVFARLPDLLRRLRALERALHGTTSVPEDVDED